MVAARRDWLGSPTSVMGQDRQGNVWLCSHPYLYPAVPRHLPTQVRYDRRVGDSTAIKFMTDGILLRWVGHSRAQQGSAGERATHEGSTWRASRGRPASVR